jgi:hypothetical protein
MFVTSETFPSNLGGLAGADAKCRAEAAAANLPGTFVAWLAVNLGPARDRLNGARGWLRPDGRPFLDDIALFAPGAAPAPVHWIFYPGRITAAGLDIVGDPSTLVYTGTDFYGDDLSGAVAGDWLFADAFAEVGSALHGGDAWTHYNSGITQAGRLYCFGIDFRGQVSPPTPTAATRLAFVTQYPVSLAGGIAGADLACANAAASISAPGTFKAYLSTTTVAAAARFDPNGPPWRRHDNVLLADTAADFLAWPPKHLAALNETEFGVYPGIVSVATGSSTPTTPGTAASTCNNWSGTGSNVPGGDARATNELYWSDPTTALPCAGAGPIYCLQE